MAVVRLRSYVAPAHTASKILFILIGKYNKLILNTCIYVYAYTAMDRFR